jgi:hypothetical protein
MKASKKPTKKQLINLYVHQKMGITDISYFYSLGSHTVQKLFKDYGIPIRKANWKMRRIIDRKEIYE